MPVQPVSAGSDDVLYDPTVSPGQLRAFLPFISGRKVQGMFINAVSFSRPSPEEIRMEAVIGERAVGELDWQAAKAEIGVSPSEGKPVGEPGAFDSGGLLELSSDNPSVVATAVKKAWAAAIPPAAGPGGETLVVRLVNYSGAPPAWA